MPQNGDIALTEVVARVERNASQTNVKQLLKFLRDTSCRRSDLAVTYGRNLTTSAPSWLNQDPEEWTIREQVYLAALDVSDFKLAQSCLRQIKARFPGSKRMKVLTIMYLEASGAWDKAEMAYNELVDSDPTNVMAWKRLICVSRSRGDILGAITRLVEYLEVFMSDLNAWAELAELYMRVGKYTQAQFCVEELILAQPENFAYHTRYAELVYTQGGVSNYQIARSYYSKSLQLNSKNNMRALYGLCNCCVALSQKNDPEDKVLLRTTIEMIRLQYKGSEASAQHQANVAKVLETIASCIKE
eukprot:TRINITY_DN12861_c0_g1_i1.p1 TRINITY_DN12861_c0_g1~~TRINITY_DN12861_c0_g1_i1.p1  ORF type:complete len:302 (-),score=33.84 TRINITY_DN12861_c0_g1_i1:29-934(-)